MRPSYDRDDDEDLEMDLEEPAAEAGGMVSVDLLMSALEKALEDVLGQEVEVSQDDEMEEPEALEDPLGADDDLEAPEEEELEESEETELEETKTEEDIAEAVFRKVLERLSKEK